MSSLSGSQGRYRTESEKTADRGHKKIYIDENIYGSVPPSQSHFTSTRNTSKEAEFLRQQFEFKEMTRERWRQVGRKRDAIMNILLS